MAPNIGSSSQSVVNLRFSKRMKERSELMPPIWTMSLSEIGKRGTSALIEEERN